MQPLYAKSLNRADQRLSLFQHLLDVESAIELVFGKNTRWRSTWTRFFRLTAEQVEPFWKTLRVAALLHDIGKANEDFQLAVTKGGHQSLRHEHLSALVLSFPSCREWLSSGGINPDMVIATILSHHVKASPASEHCYAWCQSHYRTRLPLMLFHSDVTNAFAKVAAIIGVNSLPELPVDDWCNAPPWSDVYGCGFRSAQRFRRDLNKQRNRDERRFLAALKGALIVVDAVASAIAREGKSLGDWLDRNAHTPPISVEEIDRAILLPRAEELSQKVGRPFSLHTFQSLAGQEGERTLLIAPCGAGKTLAAWEWAKRQARQGQFGRVIFLYPTRGTATEGFRDYVAWAPEGDATLLHGSSAFELAAMSENPPDSLVDKDVGKAESEARMFALGLWRFRFFSATADQFLSFMQNRYQSLCLLPALADAVIVVDEVHSYDPTMFGTLLSFLKEFDIPVLCMTATLPTQRVNQLLESGLTRFPRPEHADKLTDLTDTAESPRYRIRFEPSADNAVACAIQGYQAGKRVLIVVNRVARCIEVARAIESAVGVPPLVYHSRFKLKDRQTTHRKVVDAFKCTDSAIAVTTQVCEMSLDLDAQVLVTEVAPVSSLVQRFGRANRHLKERDSLAEVIVYPPAKHAPYCREELERASKFVESVTGTATQAQLARALENDEYQSSETSFGDEGDFLTGGYFAIPGSFRDEDEHSVQCVCDDELAQVEEMYRQGEPIDGYLVPAPKARLLRDVKSNLLRHIGVVSHTEYSQLFGLQG